MACTCDFGQFLKEALRDCLVCSLNNSSIQKKSLNENDVTLQRSIVIATAAEMTALQPSDKLTLQHKTEILSVQQVWKCCGKLGHSQGVYRFPCLFSMW